MSQIYDSLKSLITSDMITKASATLSENNSKVSSAVAVILPSLLGRLLKKGETPQIKETAEEAGKRNVISETEKIFSGNGIIDHINFGERFENALIGTDSKDFNNAVAVKSGMQSANVDRLTNWVSAIIAGFVGNKMVHGNQSMQSLLKDLDKEKSGFLSKIPADIYSKLGLASTFGAQTAHKSTPASTPGSANRATANPKKKNNWIWWLLIIILLLLLFFWWRSCDRRKAMNDVRTATEKVENAAVKAAETVVAKVGDLFDVKLPNGETVKIYKGGSFDKMIEFLNSDKFKNAKNDGSLRSDWYAFDMIDFKHNSATELMDQSSKDRMDVLVKILKAYPDAKIRIGAYADKTGTKPVNMDISKARAEFVKDYFTKADLSASRISTEGFGEEFATQPVDATDVQRAIDRHIALRFTK